MRHFLDELRNGLNCCSVAGERLLVAVSGGADSVALLCGLVEIASEFSLDLCVAHYNHRLRGNDSDADAAWVFHLAGTFNLPCDIGVVANDVLSADASALEETARNLRYQYLDKVAKNWNCPTIALAHTADDQTETVLHHFLRGTGISGLRGIPATRETAAGLRLVRPLHATRRVQLEAYLQDRSQSFRTDASNANTAMTRNKLRHLVLPMLREQVNSQVDTAIYRLSEQAAEIEQFLQQSARQLLVRSLKDGQPNVCHIDTSVLTDQSPLIVREMFRELWRHQNWSLQAMGFDQWNRLIELLRTHEVITFPNRIEARFHSETLLVLRCL